MACKNDSPVTKKIKLLMQFYSHHQDKKGWQLSTFSDHQIQYSGLVFPTCEHLYQWLKMDNAEVEWKKTILKARTPLLAKKYGHNPNHKMRDNWENEKDQYMYLILKLKAEQHEDVRQVLLETGNETIVYNHPDKFWGGKRNILGNLWAKIRSEMQIS
jgi:N-glycosidase YbiA